MNKSSAKLDMIVIDDHEGICFSLSNTLESWGCSVCSFESAETVCKAIKKSPAWKLNFLISDYRLRNDATDLEAVDKVTKLLDYPITAMIITEDTAPEEITKIEKSGLMILHKPIKPAKLRLVLSKKMKSIIEAK